MEIISSVVRGYRRSSGADRGEGDHTGREKVELELEQQTYKLRRVFYHNERKLNIHVFEWDSLVQRILLFL